jgi:hypothetical protein
MIAVCLTRILLIFQSAGDEVKIVCTPPFADSISEGDIKWDKGMHMFLNEVSVLY